MAKNETAVLIRLDHETKARLEAVRERVGIPVNEQARRALRLWLELEPFRHGEANSEATPTVKSR